jgi:Ras-related GTP-binding protein C/D
MMAATDETSGTSDKLSRLKVSANTIMETADNEMPPRILLTGLSLSGKSSICKVVLEKMTPDETVNIQLTSVINKDYVSDVIRFEVWDIPGHYELDQLDDALFASYGALVFVIDAQGELSDALKHFVQVVHKAHCVNPDLRFEVFLHKIDCIAEDRQTDLLYKVSTDQQSLFDECGMSDIDIRFHLTSIYDISLWQGMSRVVQCLIPDYTALQNLLSAFATSAGLVKMYLFDIWTKLAIATDTSADDASLFHMCSDLVDVTIDLGTIFCVNSTVGGTAYDLESQAVIHSTDGRVITLHSVNQNLAFVCVIAEGYYKYEGIVDYNMKSLAGGVCKVLQCYKWTSLGKEDFSSMTDGISFGSPAHEMSRITT